MHALAGRRRRSPAAVGEREPALARRRDDRRGERMLARPLERWPRGAADRPRRSRPPARPRSPRGLPSVSVPVLSTTSVSTFSRRSSASAFLISTPACAPRPTPTMIDIGVARPERARAGDDQHRDRGDQRVGEARLRARDAPRRRTRASATAITAGTNQPDDRSARRWIGARLRCASATICTICASSVSRADLLGAHDEARRCR